MYNDSAASRVLHLPELLEKILSHLPQQDLLLLQRTNKAFRTTTTSSIRLQRALFLAPDWHLQGRPFTPHSPPNYPPEKPANNRLLLRAFPGCYPTVSLAIEREPVPASPNDEAGALAAFMRGEVAEQWTWTVGISFPADRVPSTNSRAVLDEPSASWRRMYLSQPPCTELHLIRRWQRSKAPVMIRTGGITMGALFKRVMKTGGLEVEGVGVDGLRLDGLGGRKSWEVVVREEEERKERPLNRKFISSDRDWHFEGKIAFTAVEE